MCGRGVEDALCHVSVRQSQVGHTYLLLSCVAVPFLTLPADGQVSLGGSEGERGPCPQVAYAMAASTENAQVPQGAAFAQSEVLPRLCSPLFHACALTFGASKLGEGGAAMGLPAAQCNFWSRERTPVCSQSG